MNLFEIGKIISFHRKEAGLSQKALADLAGIGKTAMFDLENGKSNFRFKTLQKVCSILNIRLTLQSPLMEYYHNGS